MRKLARQAVTTLALAGILGIGLLTMLKAEFGVSLTRDGFTSASPLGRPPHVRHGLGSFAFLAHQPGAPADPVAYDPCRTVEYAVDSDLAPEGSSLLVDQAVRRVERATGLVFERLPDTDRAPVPPSGLLGTRREPVVITWTTPDVVDGLTGPTAGLGGSTSYEDNRSGRSFYATGLVALDAPQLVVLSARPHGRALLRAIVMHELGHVVGLDHVDDPAELMYDDNVGQTAFGPGDREGLAALGAGRCFP